MSVLNKMASICVGCASSDNIIAPRSPLAQARSTLISSILRTSDEISTAILSPQNFITTSALMTAGRRILEQAMLGAQGQIDPMRLISVYLGSLSQDFKIGDRNNSSFNWQKDVLPDYQTKDGHWSQSNLKNGPIRGVLDGHLATYIFSHAHLRVLDSIQEYADSNRSISIPTWVVSISKLEEGQHLLTSLRKKAGDTYSALSKAVHFEFLGPLQTDFTQNDALFHVSAAIEVATTVALYASASDIACTPTPLNQAIKSYFEIADWADINLIQKPPLE